MAEQLRRRLFFGIFINPFQSMAYRIRFDFLLLVPDLQMISAE